MTTPETTYNYVYVPPCGPDHGGYSIEDDDGRRVGFVWPYQTEVETIDGGTMPIAPFGSHDPEGEARRFALSGALLETCRELVSLLEMAPECTPGTDTFTAVEVAKLIMDKIAGRTTPV